MKYFYFFSCLLFSLDVYYTVQCSVFYTLLIIFFYVPNSINEGMELNFRITHACLCPSNKSSCWPEIIFANFLHPFAKIKPLIVFRCLLTFVSISFTVSVLYFKMLNNCLRLYVFNLKNGFYAKKYFCIWVVYFFSRF